MQNKSLKIILLLSTIAVILWSIINPHEMGVWWMEAAPVLIALPLLAATQRRFSLTPLLYILIFVHAVILLVGAHYTYALTPPGQWVSDLMGWERNHYDRLGHVALGFVPSMVGRELLLRTSPLKWGKWMFVLLVLSCGGISAIYEVIEWTAAAIGGEASESFLGTQGDEWDTQKDMALAMLGAAAALILLPRLHDRQLGKVKRLD